MASIVINDAVLVAAGGLVVKGGDLLLKWYRARKGGNGKDKGPHIAGLLNDIKGQGTLTLTEVGKIKDAQSEMKTNLAVMTTKMGAFETACVSFDDRIGKLDTRLYEHVEKGG